MEDRKSVTVGCFIDGFEFGRKNYESEEIADRIIADVNGRMVAEGKSYIIWKKLGNQDCMKEPAFAKNAEIQREAKQQPVDSQEDLMAMLIFRKTHL